MRFLGDNWGLMRIIVFKINLTIGVKGGKVISYTRVDEAAQMRDFVFVAR